MQLSEKTKFVLWKSKVMAHLTHIALKAEREGNQRLLNDINALLDRLRLARRRDLSAVLHDIWTVYQNHKLPELLEVIPTEEDIQRFMTEGG